MSQIETRFMCDRCKLERSIIAHNDQPQKERGAPPTDWQTYRLGDGPPMHLCYDCTIAFRSFLGQIPR